MIEGSCVMILTSSGGVTSPSNPFTSIGVASSTSSLIYVWYPCIVICVLDFDNEFSIYEPASSVNKSCRFGELSVFTCHAVWLNAYHFWLSMYLKVARRLLNALVEYYLDFRPILSQFKFRRAFFGVFLFSLDGDLVLASILGSLLALLRFDPL